MEHLKHASDQAGERGGRCGTKKKMKGESSALAFLQSQWALRSVRQLFNFIQNFSRHLNTDCG